MRTDFPKSADLSFDLHQNIRQAEFIRMLDRARNMSGGELKDDVKKELKARLDALQRQLGSEHTGALNIFATELIIARWLAAKTQNDLGQEAQS